MLIGVKPMWLYASACWTSQTKEEAEAREQQERENFSLNVHERVAEKTGLDKMDANQLRQLVSDFSRTLLCILKLFLFAW